MLIKNAHLLDPAQGLDQLCDIRVEDGQVIEIGELDGDADIDAEVDLGDKTVKIEGGDEVVEKAKEILGDLGFLAEEI